MGTSDFDAEGNPAMDCCPIQGGVEILLVASCYRNWDKLRPDGPDLAALQTLPTLVSRNLTMFSGFVKINFPLF